MILLESTEDKETVMIVLNKMYRRLITVMDDMIPMEVTLVGIVTDISAVSWKA